MNCACATVNNRCVSKADLNESMEVLKVTIDDKDIIDKHMNLV